MRYFLDSLKGLIILLFGLLTAPVVMLFAVWLIKWDKEPTNGSYNIHPTIRGDLPYFLRWYQTPDERFPGGLYEHDVKAWLDKYGKYVCFYLWAGTRNMGFGLAGYWGKPATAWTPEQQGFWERKEDDLWYYCKRFKFKNIQFKTGWDVWGMADGTFKAFPCFTIAVHR
jgi:hypothetical protein